MNFENNPPILIPAAGLGSRLFPATWGIPKELFPLGNKPALHYVLEEALLANIKNIICITSPRKEALITYLTYKNKNNNIFLTKDEAERLIPLDILNNSLNYEFVVQNSPKGVGNAILCAYDILKKNDFFCMAYPDDIILNSYSGLNALLKIHKEYNCSVIAVEKIPYNKINSYGVISYSKEISNGLFLVNNIVEKPSKESAPSEYGIIGRYIMHNNVLNYIKEDTQNACFVTSLNKMIKNNEIIIAVCIDSVRFDIGTVDGWIHAVNALNKNDFYINSINNTKNSEIALN